jgi:pimeloyl-ACP methyl ester carboxylesterase
MPPAVTIEPFTIEIPESDLVDLKRRLGQTRWPTALVTDWSDGTDLAYLRELVEHWCDRYDWRAQEARLNAFPQFIARIGNQDVHFVHVCGKGTSPVPLIVTHGWPGSFVEMLGLIGRLTDPERFGGDSADAFDVVVPSLPGYGFSSRPAQPGTTPQAIADTWVALMVALGYERFGAQGGDWGAAVSTHLGIDHAERLIGVHLNFLMRNYLPARHDVGANIRPDEEAYFALVERWFAAEGGYSHLQGTKPQTLAYGLTDSPAGLAAYIAEKFRAWSDCGGTIEAAIPKDTLLTNIAIYWFTQTIGSSMHLYWERQRAPARAPERRPPVPFALAAFPKEIATPPRSLIERVFRVDRYTVMDRGGHFAALEQPEMLAADIAAFFRPLR